MWARRCAGDTVLAGATRPSPTKLNRPATAPAGALLWAGQEAQATTSPEVCQPPSVPAEQGEAAGLTLTPAAENDGQRRER